MDASEVGRVGVKHGPAVSRGPTGLALAKLIEKRRKSRVERARQVASNIDVQAHIRRNVDMYNLDAQRLQLRNALRGMGANIPAASRIIHEARVQAIEANLMEQMEQASAVSSAAAPLQFAMGQLIQPRRRVVRAGTLDPWVR